MTPIRTSFFAILFAMAFGTANADKWTDILQTYASDTTTHQILLVKCTEGCNAEVEFYIKQADRSWLLERAGDYRKSVCAKSAEHKIP